MIPKTKVWLYTSSVNGYQAFCLVRSPYKRSAQRKVRILSDGRGLLNWAGGALSNEDAEKLLSLYEPNTLYLSEEQVAHA